jgi:hypothetical protein
MACGPVLIAKLLAEMGDEFVEMPLQISRNALVAKVQKEASGPLHGVSEKRLEL